MTASVRVDHPTLGQWHLDAERGSGAALLRERVQRPSGCGGAPNPTPYVKDGINDHVVDGTLDAVNPAATEPRSPRTCASTCRPAPACRIASGSPPDRPPASTPHARSPGSTTRGDPSRRGRRVLRRDHAAVRRRRERRRDAPSARRNALVEAVLLLRRRRVAPGAPGHPLRSPAHHGCAQRSVVPHGQPRRDLDARQVGVPVVRRVGLSRSTRCR